MDGHETYINECFEDIKKMPQSLKFEQNASETIGAITDTQSFYQVQQEADVRLTKTNIG
jgi:hypothetical protein